MKNKSTVAVCVVMAAAMIAACGGSTIAKPSTHSEAPPGPEVTNAVTRIISTCITKSFDDIGTTTSPTSIGPVSEATGTLVGLAHRYSLTAPMHDAGTKAKTLEGALSNILPDLQKCSPADANRVDAVLYKAGQAG